MTTTFRIWRGDARSGAFQDYSKAIKLNGKFAAAYINRGNAYRNKGERLQSGIPEAVGKWRETFGVWHRPVSINNWHSRPCCSAVEPRWRNEALLGTLSLAKSK